MKQKLKNLLLIALIAAWIGSSVAGCKSGVKDEDVKASVQTAIQANPETSGLMVDVKDGVVTLSGEAKDEAAKARAGELATAVKGVKSVQNNVTVAPPPAPLEITADDPLTSAVRDATKDYPGVTATVNDGVIAVSGEIKSASWKKLKMALDGLRPKRVDASNLKVTN